MAFRRMPTPPAKPNCAAEADCISLHLHVATRGDSERLTQCLFDPLTLLQLCRQQRPEPPVFILQPVQPA